MLAIDATELPNAKQHLLHESLFMPRISTAGIEDALEAPLSMPGPKYNGITILPLNPINKAPFLPSMF